MISLTIKIPNFQLLSIICGYSAFCTTKPENPMTDFLNNFCLFPQDGAQLGTVIKCLSKEKEGDSLDVEGYQRLIVTARSVAVARPGNLVKFADRGTEKEEGKTHL